MATEEKLTYIGYREGIDPRVLGIGSLLFDSANPRTKDPYIHKGLQADDINLWATADQRKNCWVAYSSGKGVSVGGGVLNLAQLSVLHANNNYNVVVAGSGTKIELLNTIQAFKVLRRCCASTDEARFWFESRLAVSRQLKRYYGLTLQHPKIWLLTGLYFMKDTICLSVSVKSSGFDSSITVPLPDPTGIAAMLQLNPNAQWSTSSGLTLGGGTTFVGDRIWAAQYHRVQAKYFDIRDGIELSARQLKLLDVFDMRASRGETSGAEVDLEGPDDNVVQYDDLQEQYGDEYWHKFSKELKDTLEDFEQSQK